MDLVNQPVNGSSKKVKQKARRERKVSNARLEGVRVCTITVITSKPVEAFELF